MIRLINTGKVPDDSSGDTFKEAFEKINSNFEFLSEQIKTPLKFIVCKTLADIKPAMDDINENFKTIENQLNNK
jgi:hypothetical protein